MGAGHALRQRRLQRLDDAVHDRRKRNAVQPHRGGRLGAQQFTFRKNHLERPKSSLVGWLLRRDQVLKRDSRAGAPAAEVARVDATFDLIGHLGKIDGHLVAGDDDFHFDRNLFIAHAVIVEKCLMLVDAVRDRANFLSRSRRALVENDIEGAEKVIDPIFIGHRLRQIAAQETTTQLRLDVAEQFQGKTRVVLDDAVNFFYGLALRPEFDRAQLQPLHENIGGGIGNRADGRAADVDPVTIDGEESDQLIALGAGKNRCVHDRVIEMLPLHGGMIADDHVAFVQILATVDL